MEVFESSALTASPNLPNLTRPNVYQEALSKLAVGSTGKKGMAGLVIPDYAARMSILDFEEFPAGEQERNALLRFRLRKTVPFPIEEAQVSYSVQVSQERRIEVLAVAIAKPILDEYEGLLVAAGYRVGLVTPSCIATLPLCVGTDQSGANAGGQRVGDAGLAVLAKAAGSKISVLLLDQTRVRLIRCVDLAPTGADEEALPEDYDVLALLEQTIAYAEDHVGKPAKSLLLCGFGAESDLLGLQAETQFGVRYAPVRSRFRAAQQENAGLLGLLEQYAA